MKTKRSGYSQKLSQASKRSRRKSQQEEVNTTELPDEKKDQPECSGVCAVAWKPAAVSR